MGAKAVLFFISAMALLVTVSVILNFWLYLLIAFTIVIVIGSIVAYYAARDSEERRFRRDFASQDFRRPVVESRRDNRTERKLRDKIESEWDNYSVFGNPEDLK